MKYKPLGRSGIMVSELCFGTMGFVSRTDRSSSERLYRKAREAGITFFDTANIYSDGEVEEYLGSFIRDERSEVVIATKGFGAMGSGPNDKGSNAKSLRLALEGSLKRLKTDYVDIYFLHQYDPLVAEEELLRTLERFVTSGKVLSLGVSNYSAYQTMKLNAAAARLGLPRIDVLQPMYSLAKRICEIEILPMAKGEGLGVISYSPLGAGLLTGRYSHEDKPATGRLVENPMYTKRYLEERYFTLAKEFSAFAGSLGVEEATLATAWVLANEAITAPIIGSTNEDHLRLSLKALDFEITKEIATRLDEIAPPPPPAHDRSEVDR